MAKKISDKMRLDFLAKQEWPFDLSAWNCGEMPGQKGFKQEFRLEAGHGTFLGIGKTPRSAIDAAIRASRKPKPATKEKP